MIKVSLSGMHDKNCDECCVVADVSIYVNWAGAVYLCFVCAEEMLTKLQAFVDEMKRDLAREG